MDELLKKYNEYMRLKNCRAEYLLADGKSIEVVYKEENFAHLLGLHKLKDIQLIQFWQDKNNKTVKLKDVIRRIKNNTFTDAMVKASVFYPDIKDRYESFFHESTDTYIAGQTVVKVTGFKLFDANNKIVVEDNF